MIPTATLRADNALAVPMLTEYVRVLLEEGEVDRAAQAGKLLKEFTDWADTYPDRVLFRGLDSPNTNGEKLHDLRKVLRETKAALAREVSGALDDRARDAARIRALEAENCQLQARVQSLLPVQHATPRPTLP